MKLILRYKYEICVFLLFVISRLPSLGNDCFNTDVWKWKTRSYDFGTGVFTLDFAKTSQKYHPGVTLMWLGTFGVKVFNLYYDLVYGSETISLSPTQDYLVRIFGLHFVQKLFVVVVIGVTLVFLFKALEKIIDRKYAAITIFLIAFEPFFLALSRVFHLEGLLSVFMVTSVVWFYIYLTGKSEKKALLISGVFGGLSFLTKTSAVYLVPYVFLVSFIWLSKIKDNKNGRFVPEYVKTVFSWILISLSVVVILWPALWVDFSNVVSNLYRGVSEIGIEQEHSQIYFGKRVENPGLTYYLVVLLLRSSPYLLVGCFSMYFLIKNGRFEDKKDFVFYLFIFSLFYLMQHTIPSKKLDRYILPAIVGMVPIASFFFYDLVQNKSISKNIKVAVLLFPLITAVYIHPDYFSYYNPFFGGIRTGIKVIEPKWMIGQSEITKYFEELIKERGITGDNECPSFECVIDSNKTKDVLSVGFPEKYYTQVHPFIRKIGGWAVIKDLTPFAKHTNFFVYPVWEDDSSLEDRFKLNYIGTIKVKGVDVYNVYESN
ncbi:glycosyltransferase family 39 protein [Patescibacteria group bacterium]|nr:glycosyltransferase family 39 protein [Patescibacteria group bacterium]